MLQISLFKDKLEEQFQKAIIKDLKAGSGSLGSKERIMSIYKKDMAKSKRIKSLKNIYGVGGYSYRASGGIAQKHWNDGIEIQLYTGERRFYNWNEIHDLIQTLIAFDEY